MGIKNWVQQGTAVYFGNGGIDLKGQPYAENKARLIASAPALLEALEYCKELLLKYEFNRIDKEEIEEAAMAKIDAAIAAARGDV